MTAPSESSHLSKQTPSLFKNQPACKCTAAVFTVRVVLESIEQRLVVHCNLIRIKFVSCFISEPRLQQIHVPELCIHIFYIRKLQSDVSRSQRFNFPIMYDAEQIILTVNTICTLPVSLLSHLRRCSFNFHI